MFGWRYMQLVGSLHFKSENSLEVASSSGIICNIACSCFCLFKFFKLFTNIPIKHCMANISSMNMNYAHEWNCTFVIDFSICLFVHCMCVCAQGQEIVPLINEYKRIHGNVSRRMKQEYGSSKQLFPSSDRQSQSACTLNKVHKPVF